MASDDIKMSVSPVCSDGGASSEIGGPPERLAMLTATLWQRLKRPLLSEKGRKNQVCLNLMVTSIYWAMRRVYNQQYGTVSVPDEPARRLSIRHTQASQKTAGPQQPDQGWQWHGWPKLNPWLTRYRVFSCVWMAYVLIRNSFRDELEALIELMFHPRLPANCYLPGRFIISEDVQRMTAIMFAFLNLLWRFIQWKAYNRLDMSVIYYLFLNDRDISKYYSLISHPAPSIQQLRRWQSSNPGELSQLPLGSRQRLPGSPMDSRERMMHNIMSYRVDYPKGEVFRLRPNRTPEACQRLRSTLANSTLIIMTLFTVNAGVIFYLSSNAVFRAKHALSNYPGCNPRLEQAVKSGQFASRSSVYFEEHVPYVILWDHIENWILWFDSGWACYVGPGFIFLYNYDLTLYWAHLHGKIQHVYQVILDLNDIDKCSQQGLTRASRHELQLWLDELVFDLQMQIQDMIKQIKQADRFLTDATSSYLVVWFSLFAYFIYMSATVREGSLPLALLLTLSLMAAVVTVIYASLLTLNRRIHKSYPLICSLMAQDRSNHKQNFISILDYFIHNQTCYTVFRLKSMTATSYLTIVGWSFSCYFLLSKV